MPRKIDFTVIYVTTICGKYNTFSSGEDTKYRSAELNVHGPTVKGWQSGKTANIPRKWSYS
ncbi:hypothetical protein NQ317_011337 [Molorchus minor]|uniref:Uncharacterized protein n=1 Tax=Molorchus minor TaxID=1323400 RepID=A0ABQ9J4L1_9CUCU|nr:hypothetical protein NQ317_011337 [Molorchus minor]